LNERYAREDRLRARIEQIARSPGYRVWRKLAHWKKKLTAKLGRRNPNNRGNEPK
jgi:hypothetical protein